MRSISSSVSEVFDWIVIVCSFCVPRSFAFTLTIPFLSMSKVTSICGTPRCAGGISANWKRPSVLLAAAIGRSPCNTWISTAGWLSAAVENVCDLEVGIVVLRSINFVNTPPIVSMPSDNGVTSSNTTSFTSPLKTPPWIAAPIATTSSGLTPLCGSFPVNFLTDSCTAGIRVDPPTKMTRSKSAEEMPASFNAWRVGPIVRSTNECVNSSNFARDIVTSKCNGPASPAVINGNEI